MHDIPDIPFQKIGCDIFSYGGKDVLVVIDYLCTWGKVKPLKNIQSKDFFGIRCPRFNNCR